MDVNGHPDFLDSYVTIRRHYGARWAKRFVLVAPLILDDPASQVRRAFIDGLRARAARDRDAEAGAWATCEWLVRDLAESLVEEAEEILAAAP